MSFAAEPYGVFVDDLLSSLTGGVVREEFAYLPERAPFKLGLGADALPASVRLHGLVDGDYHRFMPGTDLDVSDEGVITWRLQPDGLPLPGVALPDLGSRFWVSYERRPGTVPAPRLTDRNPGSVVRTLAESFAREYAVLSRQLESVYEAAFIDTAEGRDLDQLGALVGVPRRMRSAATGDVVFSRSTPAPADIAIPAGTRISSAEVPPVTVETRDDRTLRAGALSVSVPVTALVDGPTGAARAGTLTVIHRPILGIAAAVNPQDLGFAGAAETDEALRRRMSRALETGGAATPGAIVGALTAIAGIRSQDVLVAEDHVSAPGTITITIAADLDAAHAREALEAIHRVRPAGVRVVHNLVVPEEAEIGIGPGAGQDPAEITPAPVPVSEDVWFDVGMKVVVTPAGASLDAAAKQALSAAVQVALDAAIDELGIGGVVVYNRLVAAAMAVDGVQDISFELFPWSTGLADGDRRGRTNLMTPATRRARLATAGFELTMRGALVALDITLEVERQGLYAARDAGAELGRVRGDLLARLGAALAASAVDITPAALLGMLPDQEDYHVGSATYRAEFMDEGLKTIAQDMTLDLDASQQPWIRSLAVTEQTVSA
ncbi:baseplate J/gp47 family protein [Roseateles sp. P5_E7]